MRELPRIARDRLAAGPVSTPHLDPNLISGFVEHSLLPDERQRVIAHMSVCEHCRAEVQLVIGVTQSAAHGVVAADAELRPSQQRFSWHRLLRWQPVTAALAVAAIVLGVFVSIRERLPGMRHPAATAAVAMVSKPAPPPSPATAGNSTVPLKAPVQPREAKQKARARMGGANIEALNRAIAKRRADTGQLSAQLVSGSATAPKVEQAEAREFVVAAPAPPPPAPASVPAPASPAATPQSAATGVGGGVPAGSVPARGVERAPPAISLKAFAAKSPMTSRRMSPAVGPAARWTVNADAAVQTNQGAVERSLDGGRTWQRVPVSDGVTFRVVFALGRDVWAGGTAGAFYHSSDGGEHWSPVPLASTATAVGTSVGDIISIQFADATHGVVSTSTGATWNTSDGGQTWQQAPQN